MALIPVRPKGAPADSPIEYVDEKWLERWPADFDAVAGGELDKLRAEQAQAAVAVLGAAPYDSGEQSPELAQAPEPVAPPAKPAQPAGDDSNRTRF